MVRDRNNKPNTKFEKLPIGGEYSMKNIPIPKDSEYMKKLIAQMEKIIKRMRWKALFFLKDQDKYKNLVEEIEFYGKEEKYGFKSVKKPPPIKEMEFFEKEFYEIARKITFRDDNNYGKFQKELNKGLSIINKSKKIIIPADKSNNYYTCDTASYRNLRNKNVENGFMKTTLEEVNKVDMKSSEIAKKLNLEIWTKIV